MKTDDRPVYRIAVFGLGDRFQRLLSLLARHAVHNRYRFDVVQHAGPGEFDIAIVDMTAIGGAEIARTLRGVPRSVPVISVGRRESVHPRGKDDLLLESFGVHALGVLNDAAELLERQAACAQTADRDAGAEPLRTAAMRPQAARRVLVVDDSASMRGHVMLALHRLGVQLDGVASMADAQRALTRHAYALVILEPVLKDGNGLELLKRIRHVDAPRRLPVLVLSHRHGVLDLCRGALAGCDGYLAKPVAPSTLHAAVERILKRSRDADGAAAGHHDGSRPDGLVRGAAVGRDVLLADVPAAARGPAH